MSETNTWKSSSQKAQNLITQSSDILIPLHLHPDMDMVGSGLSLAAYCQSLNKKVRVVSADLVDPDWDFLPFFHLIENLDPTSLNLSQFDLIIFADCDGAYRVTPKGALNIPAGTKTLCIDHHAANKKECDLNLVEVENVSSAAQLVFSYFQEVNFKMSLEIVELLYWGLLGDTGMFEYGNNLVTAHQDASTLLQMGAPHNKLTFQIKRQNQPEFLQFIARGLNNLKIDQQARFCWISLSNEELEELKAGDRDFTYGLTPYLKTVKNTDFGILLAEEKPGQTRGRLRSRRQDGFDCSKLARQLGGGGHSAAAGFTLKMGLQEAESLILQKARQLSKEFRKTD